MIFSPPLQAIDNIYQTLQILSVAGLVLFVTRKKLIIGKKCKITRNLSDQIIVITGANSGIGKEAALELAKMGPTLILACRDIQRSLPVVEQIKKKSNNPKVELRYLDLADLDSVKKFSEKFQKDYHKLDILVNNAGISSLPNRSLTKDGFEAHMGVNHLGHFYLTNLLVKSLKASKSSRVINVSSRMHYTTNMSWDDMMLDKKYNPRIAYAQSKLANVMFIKELQRRLKGTNIKCISLTPGLVRTNLFRYSSWKKIAIYICYPFYYFISRSPLQGAQEILYCALQENDKLKGGEFYYMFKTKQPNKEALNEENLIKFWNASEQLITNKIQK